MDSGAPTGGRGGDGWTQRGESHHHLGDLASRLSTATPISEPCKQERSCSCRGVLKRSELVELHSPGRVRRDVVLLFVGRFVVLCEKWLAVWFHLFSRNSAVIWC